MKNKIKKNKINIFLTLISLFLSLNNNCMNYSLDPFDNKLDYNYNCWNFALAHSYSTRDIQDIKINLDEFLNSNSFDLLNKNFEETIIHHQNLNALLEYPNQEIPLDLLSAIHIEFISSIHNKDVNKILGLLKKYPNFINQIETKNWYKEKIPFLAKKHIYIYIIKIFKDLTPEFIDNFIFNINKLEKKFNINITKIIKNQDLLFLDFLDKGEKEKYLNVTLSFLKDLSKEDFNSFILVSSLIFGLNIYKNTSNKLWEIIALKNNNLYKTQNFLNKINININLNLIFNLNALIECLRAENVYQAWEIIKQNPNLLKLEGYYKEHYNIIFAKAVQSTLFNLSHEDIKKIADLLINIKIHKGITIENILKLNNEQSTENTLKYCCEIINQLNSKFNTKTTMIFMLLLSGLNINDLLNINDHYILHLNLLKNKSYLVYFLYNEFKFQFKGLR